MVRPRMVCRRSASKASPVMWVVNPVTRAFSTRAHLEWDPGRQSVARSAPSRSTAPRIWTSSPRMTSGTPAAPRVDSPGSQVDPTAARQVDRQQRRGEINDRGGARQVRRLDPALAAADHAGQHHRHAGRGVQPVADQLLERAFEVAVVDGADAGIGPARLEHAALGVQAIGSEGGRAPIDAERRDGCHSHGSVIGSGTVGSRQIRRQSASWRSNQVRTGFTNSGNERGDAKAIQSR